MGNFIRFIFLLYVGVVVMGISIAFLIQMWRAFMSA